MTTQVIVQPRVTKCTRSDGRVTQVVRGIVIEVDGGNCLIPFDPSGGSALTFMPDQASTVVTSTEISSLNNGTSPQFDTGLFLANYETASVTGATSGDLILDVGSSGIEVGAYFCDSSFSLANYFSSGNHVGLWCQLHSNSSGFFFADINLTPTPYTPTDNTKLEFNLSNNMLSFGDSSSNIDTTIYDKIIVLVMQDLTTLQSSDVDPLAYVNNLVGIGGGSSDLPNDATDGCILQIINNSGTVLGLDVSIGDLLLVTDNKTKVTKINQIDLPELAPVALSNDYNDLDNLPNIASMDQAVLDAANAYSDTGDSNTLSSANDYTDNSISNVNQNVADISSGLSATTSSVSSVSSGLSSTNSSVSVISSGLSTTNSVVSAISSGLSSTNVSVSAISTSLGNKADLVAGLVPASQLPSYVDDVLEYANLAAFPVTGESGKIYLAIDTNLAYRWGGSSYVAISPSLALGETSSTAYRGDRGKIAYDFSQSAAPIISSVSSGLSSTNSAVSVISSGLSTTNSSISQISSGLSTQISGLIAQTITSGISTSAPSQDALYNHLLVKQNIPTGFAVGCLVTIDGGATTVTIGTGYYTIADFSNVLVSQPTTAVQIVTPIAGIAPTYLATHPATYIGLDANQVVHQSSSPFTPTERRQYSEMAVVVHSNNTTINAINELKAPVIAPTNQLHDFMIEQGRFISSGNQVTANGANLSLNIAAGILWGFAVDAQNYFDPHHKTVAALTAPSNMRRRLQNSAESADSAFIDPTQIDVGGVLTPLSNNNRWQIIVVNKFSSNLIRWQPGQVEYNSFNAAALALNDATVIEKNIADNGWQLCKIIIKKNCTNLAADIASGIAAIYNRDKNNNLVITGAITSAAIISALGYTPADMSVLSVISSGLSNNTSSISSISSSLSTNTYSISSISSGLSTTTSAVSSVSSGLSTTNSSVSVISSSLSTNTSSISSISSGLSNVQLGASTFAGLPSAGSVVVGKRYRVSDVGVNGSDWYSDGSNWKPVNGMIIHAVGSSISTTGVTTETANTTVTIPANVLGANGVIDVTSLWSCTNNGNLKTARIRYSGISGTIYFSGVMTSLASEQAYTLIRNKGATNSQVGGNLLLAPFGTSGSAPPTSAVDTTAATTLSFTANPTNSGDTMTLESYIVKLIIV